MPGLAPKSSFPVASARPADAERGHYLSFGRPLLREASLQAIAQQYPAHLLLIETDSYPLPGRATEPRDIVAVGEALARLRSITVQQCARLPW